MIEVERYFRPEFLNRVDELIVFNPLNHEDLQRIVQLQFREVRKRVAEKGAELVLDPKAIDFLIAKGFNEDYGARPLRRAIERYIEDPLAEELLRTSFADKDVITVSLDEKGEQITFLHSPAVAAEPIQAAATPGS
jgi:ATP-dependent Clp protease ATP-binding subunit ClpC